MFDGVLNRIPNGVFDGMLEGMLDRMFDGVFDCITSVKKGIRVLHMCAHIRACSVFADAHVYA